MATSKKRTGTKNSPFFMKKGLTFSLNLVVTTDGAPTNLDSPARTGRSHLRRSGDQFIGTAVASATMTVTITNGPRGKATVSLGASLTAGLNPGLYVADVEFENDIDAEDVIGSNIFYVEVGEEATK
jgi:hypothetical protein